MFCKKCGAQLREGARFCSVCGTAIAASADQPAIPDQQAAEQAYSQPIPDQQPFGQAYNQPVLEQQPLPAPVYGQQFQPPQEQSFDAPQPQDSNRPAQPYGQPTPVEQAFDQFVQQQDSPNDGWQQDSQGFSQHMPTPATYSQTYASGTQAPTVQQYQPYQQGAAYQQPAQQAAPQPLQPGGFPTPAPAASTTQMATPGSATTAKKKPGKLLPALIGAGGLVVIAAVTTIILYVLGVGPFAGTIQPAPPGGGADQGITVSEDTITFLVRVSENASQAEQQEAYWQKVADDFHAQNPQITVEIIVAPASEYAKKFDAMVSSGQTPTVFETSGLSGEQVDNAAYPLDQLLSFINRDEYLFLNDYEALFPDKNELPTSFDVTLVYVNTTAAENLGIAVPDKISSVDQLLKNDASIVVERAALSDLLALYNPDIVTSGSIALSKDNENQIVRILGADKQSASNSAQTLFTTGGAVYYVGNKSTWWGLGTSVTEGLTVIPLENNGTVSGRFTDAFSASNTATDNQKSAATLFLAHLLGEAAQNELYIVNDRHIPLNKTVFDSYISTNKRFAFLAGRTADIKFYRNSCAELVSFSDKLYVEAILPKMNDESIRGLLNSYRK